MKLTTHLYRRKSVDKSWVLEEKYFVNKQNVQYKWFITLVIIGQMALPALVENDGGSKPLAAIEL